MDGQREKIGKIKYLYSNFVLLYIYVYICIPNYVDIGFVQWSSFWSIKNKIYQA